MLSIFANITASPLAGCLTDLVLDHEAGIGMALLCCPADFPGFVGHFPAAPVLPAVMQLLAVRLLTEVVVANHLVPVRVERLKFKGMVTPGEEVRVRVALKEREDGIGAEFSLDRDGAAIAGGTIVFSLSGREV